MVYNRYTIITLIRKNKMKIKLNKKNYIKSEIQIINLDHMYHMLSKNYIEKGKEFNLGYARVGHGADGRFTHLPIKVG